MKKEHEQKNGGKKSILVVDDEEVVKSLFSEVLEKLGYRTTSFTNSEKAFEQFCATPDDFDLILTDESMPNLTGSELARRALKIRPDIPVVICTGYGNKITQEMAEEIGLAKIILKPVGIKDLRQNIREILDSKEIIAKEPEAHLEKTHRI